MHKPAPSRDAVVGQSLRDQLQALTGCGRAIAAVDYDNLTQSRRGYRPLNIAAFCARARAEMGADVVIKVFVNGMTIAEEAEWLRQGATEIIRTRTNADPVILSWLYAERDARAVLLCTGDGKAFAAPANFHRKRCHRVVLWSRRKSTAESLLRAADRIEYCDDLLDRRAA